ncbi:ferredoxin reductase domain-containing protein [Deminuibacter soli]|uniref:Flavodoxin reductase n=1 Tax=Deminuibacter soli TaxID=2291815 RepID=A0A3E1NGA9_9BACT|nr:flavodoxin reductase [Deminuibacter soli]RFM26828.1 flavodoxin reductase [Deminuibacter soli]
MEYTLKVLSVAPVTHDVHRIRLEKPEGFSFTPGHVADVSVNKPGWVNEKRPFTFTALNSEPYVEFTIKCYTDHDGVTKQIGQLQAGDELIVSDSWGAIEYKGEGYFIAGGAGITPFIAIFRQLHKDNKIGNNKLFFSNKTAADIIYEEELKQLLGNNAIYIVTKESDPGYRHDYINEAFLQKEVTDFVNSPFYICGPDAMTAAITDILVKNGASADTVVFEK